jgi:hypothetical protein
MGRYKITKGEGRTKISLSAESLGAEVIVHIYNENAHIGAVALGEYDPRQHRTRYNQKVWK